MKLNLGSGTQTLKDHVNVDRAAVPGVDVVYDLDVAPWPFGDGSVAAIEARHVFEHVADPIVFMTECHRVLEPGGRLSIVVPYYRSVDAFTDPTHRRFCTEWTFCYWVQGNVYHEKNNAAYGGVSFTNLSVHLDGAALDVAMVKIP